MQAKPPEQLVQLWKLPHTLAGRLAQRDEFDVLAVDALAKVGHFCQCQNGMPIGLWRHVVDQVDNAVFQPAGVKAVHDVDYMGAQVNRHGTLARHIHENADKWISKSSRGLSGIQLKRFRLGVHTSHDVKQRSEGVLEVGRLFACQFQRQHGIFGMLG